MPFQYEGKKKQKDSYKMLQVCLNTMSLELWLNNIILGIQGIPCLLRKSVNLFILKNTVWLIKNGVIYLQLEEFI